LKNSHISFEENIRQTRSLFNVIEESVKDIEDLNHLKCIEGDFIIYHGSYARLKPFRFLLHFIKSIIFIKSFNINYIQDESVSENDKIYNIATVLTAEHLYNDNLKPVVDRLSKKKIKNTFLSVQYGRALSFSWASNALSISIIELFVKKKIKISNILPLLYLKYGLIPNCKRLTKYTRNSLINNYSLILSAEVCDVFSRVVAMVAKENNVEFILFQCGPLIEKTNLEISSIVSDYFLAWPESKDFFETYPLNANIQIKYFTPPRFYNACVKNKIKKYDVAVFLPWLNFTSPMKSIIDQIDLTLNALEVKRLKVCIKLHPHTDEILQSFILDMYNRFYFFPKEDDSNKLISSSKMTVNFGSTVSYDADYMMIKTAVINLDRRLENDCEFFKLKYVMNITKSKDLNRFIESFNPKTKSKEISLEAVEFIQSRLTLTN